LTSAQHKLREKKDLKTLSTQGQTTNEKLKLNPLSCILQQPPKCKFSTPLRHVNSQEMELYHTMPTLLNVPLKTPTCSDDTLTCSPHASKCCYVILMKDRWSLADSIFDKPSSFKIGPR